MKHKDSQEKLAPRDVEFWLKVFAREVIVWEQTFIAIFSRVPNSMDGIAIYVALFHNDT